MDGKFVFSVYTFPVLSKYNLQKLQRMQNRAVHLCKDLRKYDHVSYLYPALNWLSIELLVQHRSLCAMHNQFKFQCSQLEPPIVFSYSHSHATRSSALFIRPVCCHLSDTQRFFRFKTTQWWNSLTEDTLMAQDFSSTQF